MNTEQILSRIVQTGTVSAVDTSKRMARVILKETGHTSGWLKVLQHYGANFYIEPTQNIRTRSLTLTAAAVRPAHTRPTTISQALT